jgi:hypothetical protein
MSTRPNHLRWLTGWVVVIIVVAWTVRACDARQQLAQRVSGDASHARQEFKLIRQQITQDEQQLTAP